MERPSPIDAPLHITAALALGTIALLVIGVQPILLGELVNASKVSREGAGTRSSAGCRLTSSHGNAPIAGDESRSVPRYPIGTAGISCVTTYWSRRAQHAACPTPSS